MEFSQLKRCPFCGSEEFFERCCAKGVVDHFMRFDGKASYHAPAYDGLEYTHNGRRWCANCEAYLGDEVKNEVASAAVRALEGGDSE